MGPLFARGINDWRIVSHGTAKSRTGVIFGPGGRSKQPRDLIPFEIIGRSRRRSNETKRHWPLFDGRRLSPYWQRRNETRRTKVIHVTPSPTHVSKSTAVRVTSSSRTPPETSDEDAWPPSQKLPLKLIFAAGRQLSGDEDKKLFGVSSTKRASWAMS